jgi:hypothetical protein
MSVFTSIYNKIIYTLTQYFDDPEANAYAEQQEIQKQQDAEAKQRADAEAKKIQKDADNSAKAQEDAISLNERSTVSPSRAVSKISSGVLYVIKTLGIVILMIAGGYLAANEAIGYNTPFRIFSFIYGALFFWVVIPRAIIRKYFYKIDLQYYTLLPLSTYKPAPGIESFFLTPFCYDEDKRFNEKAEVELLYKNGYLKSIGENPVAGVAAAGVAAVGVAGVAAAGVAGVAAANNNAQQVQPTNENNNANNAQPVKVNNVQPAQLAQVNNAQPAQLAQVNNAQPVQPAQQNNEARK